MSGAGVTWTTHVSPHVNKDNIVLSVKCQHNSVWGSTWCKTAQNVPGHRPYCQCCSSTCGTCSSCVVPLVPVVAVVVPILAVVRVVPVVAVVAL